MNYTSVVIPFARIVQMKSKNVSTQRHLLSAHRRPRVLDNGNGRDAPLFAMLGFAMFCGPGAPLLLYRPNVLWLR